MTFSPRESPIDDFQLDYVEMYVQDLKAQTAVWRDRYGFMEVGVGGSREEGFRSTALSQGAMMLVLTQAVGEGHPAASYVLAHGDGVADIALRTGDIRAAFAQVVAHGGRALRAPEEHDDTDCTVTAKVAGFGDLTHTLVQRHAAAAGLPPGFRWLPGSGEGAEPAYDRQLRLLGMDHFAVCLEVGGLDEAADFYQAAFGFQQIFEERIVVGRQAMLSKVVQSRSETVTFTLIQPDPTAEPGQIDAFLKNHDGAGVQHIAFRTDDVVSAVSTLSRRDVEFLTTPRTYYGLLRDRLSVQKHSLEDIQELGILVDEDHAGQLFQIFTRSTHERRTLFFEVIERCGAKTFGSSNIKALYDAVELGRLGPLNGVHPSESAQ